MQSHLFILFQQPPAFLMDVLCWISVIHATHERNLCALNQNTEKGMGLQKSRYLHASLTSFKSALSSVFVVFGSVESSRCFIHPSGHLTSPPEGISMCEQAQKKKERNEVHVWMCCQQVFPGSSLETVWESHPLTLGPSEVREVKVSDAVVRGVSGSQSL